jgi:hypothetical protein
MNRPIENNHTRPLTYAVQNDLEASPVQQVELDSIFQVENVSVSILWTDLVSQNKK